MTNQRGAISLSIIIAAVLGLGLLASAYLNYAQHQSAALDHKLMQGEITDLRYQVNQDKLASATTAPTPSPLATPEATTTPPTPAPAATPAVLAASVKSKVVKSASAQPNLRVQANASSTILLAHVAAGTLSTLVDGDDHNGYLHVIINGKTGYMLASYLN